MKLIKHSLDRGGEIWEVSGINYLRIPEGNRWVWKPSLVTGDKRIINERYRLWDHLENERMQFILLSLTWERLCCS